MALRSTMATLITRTRLLINDPAGASEQFYDTDIQDVLDESRQDVYNMPLKPQQTLSGNTIQYLDYFSEIGGWEDGMVLKQFLITVVTPSLIEPIAGHFQFAATTLPPVFITGKTYDIYRAAADLLERWAARWMLNYDFTSDSQTFRRSQAMGLIEKRIQALRRKQRATRLSVIRSDLNAQGAGVGLGPQEIDRMAKG